MSVKIINDSKYKGLNFYGGKSANGKKTVLIIDGKDWHWNNTKHLSNNFSHLPIGTKFNLEHSIDVNGWLSVVWESLEILDVQVTKEECSWVDEFFLIDAMAKKNRSLASAKKGIDADNLRSMTILDLRNYSLTMNKAKKAALIALIISELSF